VIMIARLPDLVADGGGTEPLTVIKNLTPFCTIILSLDNTYVIHVEDELLLFLTQS